MRCRGCAGGTGELWGWFALVDLTGFQRRPDTLLSLKYCGEAPVEGAPVSICIGLPMGQPSWVFILQRFVFFFRALPAYASFFILPLLCMISPGPSIGWRIRELFMLDDSPRTGAHTIWCITDIPDLPPLERRCLAALGQGTGN